MDRHHRAPTSPRNGRTGSWRRSACVRLGVLFFVVSLAFLVRSAVSLVAQTRPTLPAETLLSREVLTALDEELSGVAAKDHVARLTQFHRVPASPGFHDAIQLEPGQRMVARQCRSDPLGAPRRARPQEHVCDHDLAEIVNFIDGTRSIGDIRNAVSAEFEPVEVMAVREYIELLARAGAVSFKR